MKKTVKIVIIVVLALSAGALAFVSMTAPLKSESRSIEPQTASITFTEQGSFDYDKRFEVFSLIAGEIVEAPVKKGDTVRTGDTLAVIAAEDYIYQIAQLESGIKGYQSQIQNLQLTEQQEKEAAAGNREQLAAQLAALEAERDTFNFNEEARGEQAWRQSEVVGANRRLVQDAKDQLDEAKDSGNDAAITAAEQNYAAMRQALATSQVILEQLGEARGSNEIYDAQKRGIEAQIKAIDSRISKSYTSAMTAYYNSLIESARSSIGQMNEKLGKATLTAPVDGVITEFIGQTSNIAASQLPIAVIASEPYVEVFVPTREIDAVKLGDTVEIVLDKRMGNETVAGTVAKIDDKAEIRYSALGVEERKIRVLIRPESDDRLVLGGAMDVRFLVYRQDNCLIVPKTAVYPQDGQEFVWLVKEDGAAHSQVVEKGLETRDGYVIESGINAGDRVIVDANTKGLAEGKKIAV